MNRKRVGFTLLEILFALTILSLMGMMVFGSFQSLVASTTRAEKAFDDLHVSETLMQQLDAALKSAVYFDNDPRRYQFNHEKGSGSPADDLVSWVTRSTSFLPSTFPTREGLNRVELTIGDVEGKTGLTMRAYSSLLDPESDEAESVEAWLITERVTGLSFHFYDLNEEDWVDEWERDSQLPTTLSYRLTFSASESGEKPLVFTRRVNIPVGKLSRRTRRGIPQVEEL